jgi:predicted transcriptional regulator
MQIHTTEAIMGRLTITLDDDLHQAVKETAARQGRSIGSIIEESLRLRGIKSMETARQLVAGARARAGCTEAQAIDLAVEETRAHRMP